MRTLTLAAALLAAASVAAAQEPNDAPAAARFEIRPFVGAYVPTGDQRNVMEDAPMIGGQLAYQVAPTLHVLGSLGWVLGTDRYRVADRGVQIFQYDLGVEYGLVRPMKGGWDLKPFLGLGGGGRTYAYGDDALSTGTCIAGYGAAGAEYQWGVTALRFEARNYVHCFKSPIAGVGSKTRNDLGFSLGVALHF
jgi:hypothetical protein